MLVMSDKPILVVDDTEIMRQGTVLTLRMFGYATDEARNGEEALSKVANASYAAILMDYNMVGMLGTECAFKIRTMEKAKGLARTPIIGMTASTELDIRIVCIESGMDDYIDKNCNTDDLHEKIKKWTSPSTPAAWALYRHSS